MNSVTPSTSPSSAALISGSATIGPARGRNAPDGLLVQSLVHRHDAVGGEGLRLPHGRLAHGRIPPRVPEQLDRATPHGLHRADRLENAVDVVVHHFRKAPGAGGYYRRPACHGFERREAERLGLRGKQEEIARLEEGGHGVQAAEEADVL